MDAVKGIVAAVLGGLCLVITVEEHCGGELDLVVAAVFVKDFFVRLNRHIDVAEFNLAVNDSVLNAELLPVIGEDVAAVAVRADESNNPDIIFIVKDSLLEVLNSQTIEVLPKVSVLLYFLSSLFNLLNLLFRLVLFLEDLLDLDRSDDLELRWDAFAGLLGSKLESSRVPDALEIEHSGVLRGHAHTATRLFLESLNVSKPIKILLANKHLLLLVILGDASSSGAHASLRGGSSDLARGASNSSSDLSLKALLLLHVHAWVSERATTLPMLGGRDSGSSSGGSEEEFHNLYF